MNDNRTTITLFLVVLLLATLIVVKKEHNDTPSREATQEEIVVEEQEEISVPEQKPVEKEEPIKEEEPIEEPIKEEEPEVVLTPQEQARIELVEEHGEDVVNAWEKLSRDEFFNYIGYELIIEEQYHYKVEEVNYHCYKILEDGTREDAHVGGRYYIYGVYTSDEALFDLVEYHNEFFAIK